MPRKDSEFPDDHDEAEGAGEEQQAPEKKPLPEASIMTPAQQEQVQGMVHVISNKTIDSLGSPISSQKTFNRVNTDDTNNNSPTRRGTGTRSGAGGGGNSSSSFRRASSRRRSWRKSTTSRRGDDRFDSRPPELRASIRSSDMGIEVHAEPEGSLMGTYITITSNVAGVGVLALPLAMHNASLGIGCIGIAIFALLACFSAYTLSVCCEYTQLFSQTQLLTRCLCGPIDPALLALDKENEEEEDEGKEEGKDYDDDYEYGDEKGGDATSLYSNPKSVPPPPIASTTSAAATATATAGSGSSGYGTIESSESSRNLNSQSQLRQSDQQPQPKKEKEKEGENNNKSTPPAPLVPVALKQKLQEQESNKKPQNDQIGLAIASSGDNLAEEREKQLLFVTDDQFLDAAEAAGLMHGHVYTAMDSVLGGTYFLFLLAYARVCADSMASVSNNLGLPEFFQQKLIWLCIGGVLFFAFSARRTLAELTLTSIIAFLTIIFVLIVMIIRFVGHPSSMGAFEEGVRYFDLDANFLSAFVVYSSAYGYHINHPALYQELRTRTPALMQRPVLGAMGSCSLLYVATGVIGYLMFGNAVANDEAAGDVVNNFSKKDILVNVSRVGLLFHFSCVFPIMCGAVKSSVHRTILRIMGETERAEDPEEPFKQSTTSLVLEVATIVGTSCVLAGLIPGIDIVISLAGCAGSNASIFIAPGICGIAVFGELLERQEKGDIKDVCDLVTDQANNNFGFSMKISFKTSYYLNWMMLIVGVLSSVGGFIQVLSTMA